MTHFLIATLLLASSGLERVARRTMDYDFTVCGVPYKFPGHKIDWNYNPTYNNYREWPWQFARHYFLKDLAAYYRESGDEKAAQTFVDILTSFIDQAPPPPEGAHAGATKSWRTIDTGLRATGWIAAYGAFTNSPAFTPAFRGKFIASLKDHLVRLRPAKTSNNWRIMELRGIVDIVLEFPKLDPHGALLKGAETELKALLDSQLYPDGFQFELAPGYHSILDADYCAIADKYRAAGRTPPAFLEAGVERAFEMYAHIADPSRRCPAVNDSGRMHIVQRMAKAAELFPKRTDFLWLATDGREGTPPDYLSYAFPYAGAVVFRNSWAADAVWGYVDMSPYGRSHQHEDKLNFLLYAFGRMMLTEGGCYAYDTSEMRKYVLSTRAHNTIRIDGKDQDTDRGYRWDPAMLHQKADLAFSVSPDKDVARATFSAGYGKGEAYDDSVTHTRTVEFVKSRETPFFRITDELVASNGKTHTYEQMWHLEKCELSLKDDSFVADFGKGVVLKARARSENGRFVDLMGTKEPEYQGWMPIEPPGPHEHRPIHTPVLKGSFAGRTKIVTIFLPMRRHET